MYERDRSPGWLLGVIGDVPTAAPPPGEILGLKKWNICDPAAGPMALLEMDQELPWRWSHLCTYLFRVCLCTGISPGRAPNKLAVSLTSTE